MSNQTQVTISVREFGDRVNCYIVLDSPGINCIAGSIQWDPSILDFDKFTTNPHLLSFNDNGDMQTTRWSMVNDTFVRNEGFLSFLVGCSPLYEVRNGAIGLLSFNKKITSANGSSIKNSKFPINWSAADKSANPIALDILVI